MKNTRVVLILAVSFLIPHFSSADIGKIKSLPSNQSLLVVVGTNDVHGSFVTHENPQLKKNLGGADWFSGYLQAARSYLTKNFKERGKLLLLDAGDATQGTLFSNFTEGKTAIKLMKTLGYTAAILGNHGYDFGPDGWTIDKCPKERIDCNAFQAIENGVEIARDKTENQHPFEFLGVNVKSKSTGETPRFLKPYTLVPFQGRSIAIIGMENPKTSSTTVPENVASLLFTDAIQEINETIEQLWDSGKADLFILITHEGDRDGEENLKSFLKKLAQARKRGKPGLDAVIAGHTHDLNDENFKGIPYIQSRANGEFFGVIELVVEKSEQGRLQVVVEKTNQEAGIPIESETTSFYGETVTRDTQITLPIIEKAQTEISAIAKKKVTFSPKRLTRVGHRISDSEVGNLVADLMKTISGAKAAVIGSGDIRDELPQGNILYENFFEMMPKNLELVRVKTMPTKKLVENMKKSIETCDRRGALQISGIKAVFRRDCDRKEEGIDPQAQLLKILDNSGNPIYEFNANQEKFHVKNLDLATTDFILSGGAGYPAFKGSEPDEVQPGLRDLMVEELEKTDALDPAQYKTGRYINCEEPRFKNKIECLE